MRSGQRLKPPLTDIGKRPLLEVASSLRSPLRHHACSSYLARQSSHRPRRSGKRGPLPMSQSRLPARPPVRRGLNSAHNKCLLLSRPCDHALSLRAGSSAQARQGSRLATRSCSVLVPPATANGRRWAVMTPGAGRSTWGETDNGGDVEPLFSCQNGPAPKQARRNPQSSSRVRQRRRRLRQTVHSEAGFIFMSAALGECIGRPPRLPLVSGRRSKAQRTFSVGRCQDFGPTCQRSRRPSCPHLA